MQKFIKDERTGIEYELNGDIYYPIFKDDFITQERKPLSKYGRLREQYLKEHRKILYSTLMLSGKIFSHLEEIDERATNMSESLIKELAEKQGVTEHLKKEDQMKWVGLMNNICACVDEIILNEIIYV